MAHSSVILNEVKDLKILRLRSEWHRHAEWHRRAGWHRHAEWHRRAEVQQRL